jgi:hypothetical protein
MAKGVKNDSEKPDYSLLPLEALEGVVRVLAYGAKKYSRSNWTRVRPTRRYFAAALRHLAQYKSGEQNDPESGQSHLAHAVASLVFCLWFEQRKKFSPRSL